MFTAFSRTIILYLIVVIGIRMMGKRQVGELEPSELVLALLIADLASVPMQDYTLPLHTGVIPMLTLLSISMILSIITIKSVRFRVLLCGSPSIIIKNGKIDQKEMVHTRLTIDELLEELRNQGYTDLSEVRYAILETNGMLSVLTYKSKQPPNAMQLNITVDEAGLPLIVISDGYLMEDNLKKRGYDKIWLKRQIAPFGCHTPDDVFLMTVDEIGGVYCVPKEVRS